MPMSAAFQNRLYPVLSKIEQKFGTPFHIYDETGIRQTAEELTNAFAPFEGFREFYAVKALPNPRILKIMGEMGFGFDCSSIAELMLSRRFGARGRRPCGRLGSRLLAGIAGRVAALAAGGRFMTSNSPASGRLTLLTLTGFSRAFRAFPAALSALARAGLSTTATSLGALLATSGASRWRFFLGSFGRRL